MHKKQDPKQSNTKEKCLYQGRMRKLYRLYKFYERFQRTKNHLTHLFTKCLKQFNHKKEKVQIRGNIIYLLILPLFLPPLLLLLVLIIYNILLLLYCNVYTHL
jgi:hypothetical protein